MFVVEKSWYTTSKRGRRGYQSTQVRSAKALYCNWGLFLSAVQASRRATRSTQIVSSLRSSFAPVTAAGFIARRAATSGRSFSCSMSVIAVSSAILDLLRLPLLIPVKHALFPDVPQTRQHDADINQHLPEPEHAQAGGFERLFHDRPGIQEYGLDIEQDEEHADQVELHGEALAGIADGLHTALIGRHLGRIVFVLSDEVRQAHNRAGNTSGHEDVYQQRKIAREIKVRHDRLVLRKARATTGKHLSLEVGSERCQPLGTEDSSGFHEGEFRA